MKKNLTLFGEPARIKHLHGESYMVSSLELMAGLHVREVPVSKLPPEVVQELLRLRRTWPARS